MGAPLGITRTDYSSGELRHLSSRFSDGAQVRRMLALVLEGRSRTEAAELNGMDRQTLRDWVHRYNALGVEGLRVASCAGPGAGSDGRAEGAIARPSARGARPGDKWRGALALCGLAGGSGAPFWGECARTHDRQMAARTGSDPSATPPGPSKESPRGGGGF